MHRQPCAAQPVGIAYDAIAEVYDADMGASMALPDVDYVERFMGSVCTVEYDYQAGTTPDHATQVTVTARFRN